MSSICQDIHKDVSFYMIHIMADFRLEAVKHQKLTRKISISMLDSPTPSLTLVIEKNVSC